MTKHLLTLAAAAAMAMTASAQVDFTFGNSLDGWNFGDNAELKDGHVVVDMPGGNGSKYRQDFKWSGTDLTINPATDKVFAFKFIGEMPMANYSFELRDPGELPEGVGNTITKGNFRKNTNTANTLTTKGGNYVLYVDLSSDATYAQWPSEFTPSLFQMKVADVAADAEVHTYTIDWIKSFASLDELKENLNVADDENDTDEGAEEKSPVVNTTTGVGYNSLTDALNAAVAGDEIEISEDQTIGSRCALNKAVTISGATGAETISPSNNNYIVFLVPNNEVVGDIYIKNLVIAGSGKTTNASIFEINKGQNTVHFENVTFKNFDITNNAIQQKGAGKSVLKNVKFENVNISEGKSMVFLGDNCASTLEGEIKNTSVILEKTGSKLYVGEGGFTGDVVPLSFAYGLSAGVVAVYGTTSVDMFSLANEGFHLEADEANNNIVIAEGTLGIGGVEIENAPAEYYNLQGVKVAEPAPGLYIMRQGGKSSKVVIR